MLGRGTLLSNYGLLCRNSGQATSNPSHQKDISRCTLSPAFKKLFSDVKPEAALPLPLLFSTLSSLFTSHLSNTALSCFFKSNSCPHILVVITLERLSPTGAGERAGHLASPPCFSKSTTGICSQFFRAKT